MRVEFPELKRCCFCLPLRRGFITWGYIRLMVAVLLTALLSCDLVHTIQWYLSDSSYSGIVEDVVMVSLFVIALVMDIAFTMAFIIGGHRKSVKLLHIFYIYSLVILSLNALFFIGVSIMDIITIHHYLVYTPGPHMTRHFIIIRARFIFGAFLIGIQVYTILLIRSEENKLRNSSKNRYGNLISNVASEDRVNTWPVGDSTEGQKADVQFEAVIDQFHSAHNESCS